MVLASTNVKLDPEKLQLAKLKGINVSKVCRDALDTCLKISEGDIDMLKNQLVEIEKQIKILNLEKKLILEQLEDLESVEALKFLRDTLYEKHKQSLSRQIERKVLDWNTVKDLFRFPTTGECERWIKTRLEKDGLL